MALIVASRNLGNRNFCLLLLWWCSLKYDVIFNTYIYKYVNIYLVSLSWTGAETDRGFGVGGSGLETADRGGTAGGGLNTGAGDTDLAVSIFIGISIAGGNGECTGVTVFGTEEGRGTKKSGVGVTSGTKS